jgi:hypothetical protein
MLENCLLRAQTFIVKTVTYPLNIPEELLQKVQAEAELRKVEVAALFRDLIANGINSLPPFLDERSRFIAETWKKLGPAPNINYGK